MTKTRDYSLRIPSLALLEGTHSVAIQDGLFLSRRQCEKVLKFKRGGSHGDNFLAAVITNLRILLARSHIIISNAGSNLSEGVARPRQILRVERSYLFKVDFKFLVILSYWIRGWKSKIVSKINKEEAEKILEEINLMSSQLIQMHAIGYK